MNLKHVPMKMFAIHVFLHAAPGRKSVQPVNSLHNIMVL